MATAKQHAEADRLLAAMNNEDVFRPRELTVSTLRHLRSDCWDDMNPEWADYIAVNGPCGIYSFLLTLLRASMWPAQYVVDLGVVADPLTALAQMALLGVTDEELGQLYRKLAKENCTLREFAVHPFDDKVFVHIWVLDDKEALVAVSYDGMTRLDTTLVTETCWGISIMRCFWANQ
jgi:hypothetical protein